MLFSVARGGWGGGACGVSEGATAGGGGAESADVN